MTESWNVEEITTPQIHIEEPTCITNSDTTTNIDFEHIIADKFIRDTSIEYHVPVGVLKTKNVRYYCSLVNIICVF